MALVLMIVAPERFRDEELFDTQAELIQAGHRTMDASTRNHRHGEWPQAFTPVRAQHRAGACCTRRGVGVKRRPIVHQTGGAGDEGAAN